MPPTDDTTASHGMVATLHDACERAMRPSYPLPTMLRLYRNVVALTRALMRARVDAGRSAGLDDRTVAMLEAVRDSVDVYFPDRQMPVQDALLLQEATIRLARVAHRARIGRPLGRLPALVAATTAFESSPIAAPIPQAAAPNDDVAPTWYPVDDDPAEDDPAEDDPWADNPLSAWRKDHVNDRDQRAHERLRTVLEERIFKPAWAEGERLRQEKQELAMAEALAA